MGNHAHYPTLLARYPLLATSQQAIHWESARGKTDDSAIIRAWAAMQFQDMPTDGPSGRISASLAVRAWGDAINGGIVVC